MIKFASVTSVNTFITTAGEERNQRWVGYTISSTAIMSQHAAGEKH